MQARAWNEAAALLEEALVVEWPHTCERIAGRDNYIAVNRAYPEPWQITVRTVSASGDTCVVEADVAHPGGVATVASSMIVRDGRIVRAREYWVEVGAETPPEWRAGWTQRMPAPQGLSSGGK
jgi:hypothetical protein